jgi:hypothetical protein
MKPDQLAQIVVGPPDVASSLNLKAFSPLHNDLSRALDGPRKARLTDLMKRDYGMTLRGDYANATIRLCWKRCRMVHSEAIHHALPKATHAKIKKMQADANRTLGAMTQAKKLLRYFPENYPDTKELVAAVASIERIVAAHAREWGSIAGGYPPPPRRRGQPEHIFTPLVFELGALLQAAGLTKTQTADHLHRLFLRSGLLSTGDRTTPHSIKTMLSSRRSES